MRVKLSHVKPVVTRVSSLFRVHERVASRSDDERVRRRRKRRRDARGRAVRCCRCCRRRRAPPPSRRHHRRQQKKHNGHDDENSNPLYRYSLSMMRRTKELQNPLPRRRRHGGNNRRCARGGERGEAAARSHPSFLLIFLSYFVSREIRHSKMEEKHE